jgi:hypothetical protein
MIQILTLLLVAQISARPNPKRVVPETEVDRAYQDFAGISTFAHLSFASCTNVKVKTLGNEKLEFDVAIVGIPFDAAVSFRPGARFGPNALRVASKRYSYEWVRYFLGSG